MDQTNPVKFDPETVASDAYKRGAEAARPPVRLDALNEQEGTATTTSPTGTPKVAPKAVPWLLVAGMAIVAGLEALGQHSPNATVQMVCHVLAADIGTAAGVASPGLRTNDGAQ